MKTCVNCGSSIDDAVAFCTQCGANQSSASSSASASQERFCRNCGAKLTAGSSFCHACGSNVGSEASGAAGSGFGSAFFTPSFTAHAAPVAVSDWLVFSVITTLVFFPAGVGALIFSLLARAAANNGDAANANSLASVAKVWNVVLWLLAFGGLICAVGAFLLFGGVAGVLALLSV